MAGRHLRGRYSVRRSLRRLLASTALGLLLALIPVEVGVDEGGVSADEPVALAKGGNGGDRGGDRGGHGRGHGKGGGKATADGKRLKGDAAKQAARNRFNQLTGNGNSGNGNIGTDRFVLTDGQTLALLHRGWDVNTHSSHGGFENHGQYVSTMVQICKELGYNGSVGALQANFMPAYWYEVQAEWRDPGTDATRKAEIELQLADMLEVAKPGEGPEGDEWAAYNLDVDGDGMITEDDLTDALNGDTPPAIFWPGGG